MIVAASWGFLSSGLLEATQPALVSLWWRVFHDKENEFDLETAPDPTFPNF